MLSYCNDCGRAAARYWGTAAYCSSCLIEAKRDDPKAHACIQCRTEQPPNVSWNMHAPCGTCQAQRPPAKASGRRKVAKPRWPGQLESRPLVD